MLHKYYFEFEPFWTRQRSRNSAPFFPIDLVTCFRIPLLVISLFQSPNLNRIEKQVGIGEVGGGENCSKKIFSPTLFSPRKRKTNYFFCRVRNFPVLQSNSIVVYFPRLSSAAAVQKRRDLTKKTSSICGSEHTYGSCSGFLVGFDVPPQM